MGALIDRALFLLGLAAWVVAGTPRFKELSVGQLRGAHAAGWTAAYVAFGVCFVLARTTRDEARERALTVAQSVLAIALLALGMPHFEGALLTIVAAQASLVAARPIASAWIAAQAVPLFVAILPSHQLDGAAKATLEYLAFSFFATTMFALRKRERDHASSLGEMNAQLMATRALLEQNVRVAEQSRIRRELHDAVGHTLVRLSPSTVEPAGRM